MMEGDRRAGGPAAPRMLEPFDGVLIVDKPPGLTSHDVVVRVRKRFKFRKVGHGGTLDPLATGVLVILIGRGTKLSSRFIGSDKTYEATMRLGVATDSQDADGQVVSEADYASVTAEQLEAEMAKRTGDIMQTPPMVSAAKVDGIPLYKRARRGQTIEREPKLIHVYEFSLNDFTPPLVRFTLRCTKGTYVRTLCADIGESLGCGAHVSQLRRTLSGELGIEQALTLEQVLNKTRDELKESILPLRQFAGHAARRTEPEA